MLHKHVPRIKFLGTRFKPRVFVAETIKATLSDEGVKLKLPMSTKEMEMIELGGTLW